MLRLKTAKYGLKISLFQPLQAPDLRSEVLEPFSQVEPRLGRVRVLRHLQEPLPRSQLQRQARDRRRLRYRVRIVYILETGHQLL